MAKISGEWVGDPWLRQPGEPPRAHQNLRGFLFFPKPRDLRAYADMSGLSLSTARSYRSRFRWDERAIAYDQAMEARGDVLGSAVPPSTTHAKAYRQIAEDGFSLVLDAWRQIRKGGATEIPFHQIWGVASGAAERFVDAVAAAGDVLDGTEVLDESNCTVGELRLISKLTKPENSNGG